MFSRLNIIGRNLSKVTLLYNTNSFPRNLPALFNSGSTNLKREKDTRDLEEKVDQEIKRHEAENDVEDIERQMDKETKSSKKDTFGPTGEDIDKEAKWRRSTTNPGNPPINKATFARKAIKLTDMAIEKLSNNNPSNTYSSSKHDPDKKIEPIDLSSPKNPEQNIELDFPGFKLVDKTSDNQTDLTKTPKIEKSSTNEGLK